MIFHSDFIDFYIKKTASRFCRITSICDYNDLYQVGNIVRLRLYDKPIQYILASIKYEILSEVKKFINTTSFSLRSDLYYCAIPTLNEFIRSEFELEIIKDKCINNLSMKDISKKYHCSISTLYRLIKRVKDEIINA